MYNIGFTGTKEGMTTWQGDKVRRLMIDLQAQAEWDTMFRHGDCIGADAEAHLLAYQLGMLIQIYPQDSNTTTRARADLLHYSHSTVVHPAKPPLSRNEDIVRASDIMIAAPNGPERRRSGTWATLRFAVRQGKPVHIIYPSGDVEVR